VPLYVFRCVNCQLVQEEIKETSCAETVCSFCGAKSIRAYDLQTVKMVGDIEPHFDISLGENIGSRREYREKLAYNNAYSPDLFMNDTPSDGRLTKEERDEVEGRQVDERGTIFEKRNRPGWGANVRVGDSIPDAIIAEGKADYEPIKDHIKKQHERRRDDGK